MNKYAAATAAATAIPMALILALKPMHVTADPWSVGGSNSGWKPDNRGHYGCWELGGDTIPTPLFDAFWINFGVNTGNVMTPGWESCNNTTDVRLRDDLVDTTPPFILGQYSCLYLKSNGECERARVEANNDFYVNNAPDWYCHMYHDWCHELGHSLGLSHDESVLNCMKSGNLNACGTNNSIYTDHHRDVHIPQIN